MHSCAIATAGINSGAPAQLPSAAMGPPTGLMAPRPVIALKPSTPREGGTLNSLRSTLTSAFSGLLSSKDKDKDKKSTPVAAGHVPPPSDGRSSGPLSAVGARTSPVAPPREVGEHRHTPG